MLRDHLRPDVLSVTSASVVMIVAASFAGFTLREWASLMSVVCLLLLLWRAVAYLPDMSYLARALATVLGIDLAAAAFAQYLLIRQLAETNPAVVLQFPANTLGVLILLGSRVAIVALIVLWPYLLRRWEWARRHATPVV